MLKLIDGIPLRVLLPLAIIILLAPFTPLPHALEKLVMLKNGTLRRPLDVFDDSLPWIPWAPKVRAMRIRWSAPKS